MERRKVVRTIITGILLVALVSIIIISQKYDPTNPHATIDRQTWINGPKGHGYAVLNNQQPEKQCYPCHEKKGLGGESFCLSCHEKSGVKVNLPQ